MYDLQDKFDQIAKELPQLIDAGCEVRVKGFGYSVQRAKGSTDEPTVGDNLMGVVKCLACVPLINRLTKEQVHTCFYTHAGTVSDRRGSLRENETGST